MVGMSELDRKTDTAIAMVEEQFAAMYRRIKTSMRRRAELVHPELQVMGYMILNTLGKCGPTHAGVLAERLEIDKGLLSRQLQSLERLGLLERQSDPKDKRAVILTVSPAADSKITEVRASEREMIHEELRDWEIGDLEKLAELLARVNAVEP